MTVFAYVMAASAAVGLPPPIAHERAFEQQGQATAPAPKSVWRLEPPSGAVHLQSTLHCPPAAGAFRRTDVIAFDGFGYDVACMFKDGNSRIALFLSKRRGQSIADDFDDARAALVARDRDTKPADEASEALPGATNALTAAYETRDGFETGIWTADLAGWTLTFRATYAPDARADVVAALSKMFEQTRATAGAHLAACAAARPVARNGVAITDRELVTRLALVAGMSEQAGSENITALSRDERWCVEETAPDQKTPMLYWRNIANDGADGPLDRLMLMTQQEPPVWLISGNAIANMLVDKRDNQGPIVHQLTEARGDAVFMFAFYRGRPALRTLLPFVQAIVTGHARPIAKYDPKTNTVTLPKASKPGN
jgi:hypothetical protein